MSKQLIGNSTLRYAIYFICILGFAACNEKKFSADKKPTIAKQETVGMSCVPGQQGSRTTTNIRGISGTSAVVNGEFCAVAVAPPVQPTTNVYFIIDFSGSMGPNDAWGPGADPGTGTSCGRLEAAAAVLNKVLPTNYVSQDGRKPPVNVGAIAFGSKAKITSGLVEIDSFRSSKLNYNNFCKADLGGTNYQDAFEKARSALNSVQGEKLVFFITDGMPTYTSSSDSENIPLAKSTGLTAAEQFRAVSGVKLFAVYLQTSVAGSQDANSYLLSIVGNDQSRLKIAGTAGDLVNQISLLPIPGPNTIVTDSSNSYSAQMTAPGFSTQQVKIKMDPKPTADGHYRFATEPLTLFYGTVGQTVANTVRVTAKSTDGSIVESVAIINFMREPD